MVNADYVLPNNTSITTLNTTGKTWEEMCTSYKSSSEWMGTPSVVAAAEIFQREIYVVLFNSSKKNVIFLKPQSMTDDNHRKPFILGKMNSHVFLPLLTKHNKIRLLGANVTSHLQSFYEDPEKVRKNFILTSAETTTEVYRTSVADNQPLDYSATILKVNLIWIHSTAPQLVSNALDNVILLDWEITATYCELVTKEATNCMKLLHEYVYDKLLQKAKSVSEETDNNLAIISNRIDEEEDAREAEDYNDEYMKYDSDIDEYETNDESNNDDQSDESDEQYISRYSDFVDTLEDDKESVTEAKTQIEHSISELSTAIYNCTLLPASNFSAIHHIIDYATSQTSEHTERINRYPDVEDFDADMFAEELLQNNKNVPNALAERSSVSDEPNSDKEAAEKIIMQSINRINEKLNSYKEYMVLHKENLWEEKHRKTVSSISDYVLRYINIKRCPSVYFIYSGFELMYIGLTKSVSSRFASGHAAFTKLLTPCYHYQPFRICFFGLDINGLAIENSQTPMPSIKYQATTASSSTKRLKIKEAVLLDCIEQLLINHFKPAFNTQGIENFHGVKDYMNLIKKIRIQIPVIFLSPYPELITEDNQDIITITAKV
ncbi:unnamed protein product [Adineta steineri]|uniref:Uncharacterized protein n=1 Tax=Adineta steineri TaxID=433720 RepID=A0A815SMC6_9BILA|nr:unnamed protein product [Adineta steineri]CAF1511979.1 unnamed protein product [Adineta steineri]CAF3552756.1 unnamed protein product [Adineta steineri]CAF4167592.1 unnamed protein product [Adineta steineri]